MSADKTAIILLASGLSKRFGTKDKLLANLNGTAVIDHTLTRIAPVGFGLHVAVTRPVTGESAAVHDKLAHAGYIIIENSLPEVGQGRSLALGAQAVIAAGFTRACVALADMPLIPTVHFTRLLELSQDADQVVTEAKIKLCDDTYPVRLPPCVFSGAALLRLSEVKEDKGAKTFLREPHTLRAQLSAWDVQDIDTLEDLQAIEHDLKFLSAMLRL